MRQLRRADDRGHAQHGWLESRHTFSFADYHDPAHMGFRALRVLNDDRVAPGRGFGAHGHRDMEIISYVVDGALGHRDSMGHGSVIRPGDVQRMSAGTGVRHSEMNASADQPVHFLQIWIEPARRGLAPSYEQRHFEPTESVNRWRLVASSDGRDDSVTIHQDVEIYLARPDRDAVVSHTLAAGRHAWIHVVRGEAWLADQRLTEGDAVGLDEAGPLALRGGDEAELLLFDLA